MSNIDFPCNLLCKTLIKEIIMFLQSHKKRKYCNKAFHFLSLFEDWSEDINIQLNIAYNFDFTIRIWSKRVHFEQDKSLFSWERHAHYLHFLYLKSNSFLFWRVLFANLRKAVLDDFLLWCCEVWYYLILWRSSFPSLFVVLQIYLIPFPIPLHSPCASWEMIHLNGTQEFHICISQTMLHFLLLWCPLLQTETEDLDIYYYL